MSETQEELATVANEAIVANELVKTAQAIQQVIYCGPTLPRQYGLPQYRVFNNGLPAHVQQLVDKCAALGMLIVPVSQLAKTRIAISTKGSAQAAFYQQIIAAFSSKAVKKQ